MADGQVIEPIERIVDVKITQECFDDIRVRLLALGYIDAGEEAQPYRQFQLLGANRERPR